MNEATIEAIMNRLDKLEQRVASLTSVTAAKPKDWKSVIGMFEGSEFQKQVDAEILAMREAEWQRVQNGEEE